MAYIHIASQRFPAGHLFVYEKCFEIFQIRENDASGNILGKYCGSNLPLPIVATGNKVWVKFRTDGSGTRSGFKVSYSRSKCSYPSAPDKVEPVNSL